MKRKTLLTAVLALFFVICWNDAYCQTYFSDTTCQGVRYTEHGFDITPTSPGYVYDTLFLKTTSGEDSLVFLQLYVGRTYSYVRRKSICEGNDFTEFGFHIINPPVGYHEYDTTYYTVCGCDSTYHLKLTVQPSYDILHEDTICHGESYNKYGFDFGIPDVGIHEDYHSFFTSYECDSIIRVKLHVGAIDTVELWDTTCFNQGYHKYGIDTTDIAVGDHTLPIYTTSSLGCDSTVYIHLHVNPSYSSSYTDSICYGESYTEHGFYYENPAVGVHDSVKTLQTTDGCDSIINLHLTVNPVYDITFTDTIQQGESYYEHGYTIIAPPLGWTYDNHYGQSVAGCDSTTHLHLLVAQVYDYIIYDTICHGQDYHGYNFDTLNPSPGLVIMQQQLHTVLGADSIVTLHLSVGALHDVNIGDTICHGESYHQHGFHFDNPDIGFHHDTLFLSSVYHCDSTVRLTLYVAPTYDTTLYDTICHGEDYKLHGFNIIQPDQGSHLYTNTYPTQCQCDSVVHLSLFVRTAYSIVFNETICYGEDYHGHGFDTVHPAQGMCVIPHLFETVEGCDSLVTLRLYVAKVYNITFIDKICIGEDYNQHGFYYYQPEIGEYDSTKYLQSVFGCDSTVTLLLSVLPPFETLFTDTICEFDDYNKHGFTLSNVTPEGLHQYKNTFPAITHCDSVVKLNLWVNPAFDTTFYDTICYGENYHKHGFDTIKPAVGLCSIRHNFETSAQCDSIVNLELTVVEVYNDIRIIDTICYGDDYDEYGFHFYHPEVGDYKDSSFLQSVFGCDSVVRLWLNVSPVFNTLFTDTICDNEEYHEHGFHHVNLTAGILHDTLYLHTLHGCDSIVCLDLTVNPTFDTLFNDAICFGESYHEHGFHFDTPDVGWHYDTINIPTINGCDSTMKLALYVVPALDTLLTDTACYGDDYHEHGFNLDSLTIGWHVDTLHTTSILGCDSTVRLVLYVAPIFDTLFTDTVCDDEGYHLHGFNLDSLTAGIRHDTLFLQTLLGCDSIIRLDLTVNPTFDTLFNDAICFGESYHEHGFHFDTPDVGWHYDTINIPTINGCDSTMKLALYVVPALDTLLTDTACYGDGYHEHGFNLDSLTIGWHVDTLHTTSILGCDSTVRLNLYVAPIFDTLFTDTVCDDEGYHLHGFNLDSLTAGIRHDTLFLQTILGCDSIIRLDLTVNPTFDTLFTDTVCFGEGYHEHGFDFDSLALGWKFDTLNLATICDCDSTVRLELYVAPVYDTLFTDSICFGDGYHEHGFNLDSLTVGWHDDTLYLASIFECDSTVRLNIYVAPTFDTLFSDSICFGEGYHDHGFDIDDLTVGVRHDTLFLHTILGCDSIIRLDLTVNPTFDTLFTDTVCFGEGYHEHGFDFDSLALGWKFDTLNLATICDCDSTVRLELYVAPVYDTLFTDSICFGEGYHEHGFDFDSLTVGWHDDTLYLASIFECDSTVRLNLYVAPTFDTLFTDSICFGEGYHDHGFDLDNLTVGVRHDTLFLQTILGCDSIIRLDLTVNPTFDTLFTDTVCFGEGYHEHGFDFDSLALGWKFDTLNLATIWNCDSTVRLELYVAQVYDTLFTDTICYGDGYHEHGFDFDSLTVGWHDDTLHLASIFECDSTVRLNLYVAPTFDTLFTDSICFGEGYHEHGFDLDNLPTGWHLDTMMLTTVFGCDSAVRLILYVAPLYNTLFIDTICSGESYHEHGFYLETPPLGWSNETHSFSTIYGCDSVVRLELYVAPVYDTLFTDSICFGESYHEHNFHLDDPAVGTHNKTQLLHNIYGCDSTIRLKLFVTPTYSYDVYDSICEGDYYNDYGLYYLATEPGINHIDSEFETMAGCDSIYHVTLKVEYTFQDPEEIHGSDEIYVTTNIVTGFYTYSVDTIPGCREYEWRIKGANWYIKPDFNKCEVQARIAGTANLKVIAKNRCSVAMQSKDITAKFFGTGIDEDNIASISVYPNPCRQYVNIEGNGIEEVRIYSQTGVIVKSEKYDSVDKVTLDLRNMVNSLYVIEVITSEGRFMQRISVTNN